MEKYRLLVDSSGMIAGEFKCNYTIEYKQWSDLDLYLQLDTPRTVYLINRKHGVDLFWMASELPWRDNKWLQTASNVTDRLKSEKDMIYVESIPALIRESLIPTKSIGVSGLRIFAPKNERRHIINFLNENNLLREPLEDRLASDGR